MKSKIVMRLVSAVVVGTIIATHGQASAQSSTFAAATVQRNMSGSSAAGVELQLGGQLTVTNTSPRDMIRFAFNLPDFAVIGGPDWLASERYDIVARAERDLSRDEAAQMLRALVIERFKLQLREEKRDELVYALVTIDADDRLGPRLTPTRADCAAAEREGTNLCRFDLGGGSITAVGRPMARLVRALGVLTGRIVVDKTGLVGDYDMRLTWAPDPSPGRTGVEPSLQTALQEQLGLHLEGTVDEVAVVVIDSAERPVE